MNDIKLANNPINAIENIFRKNCKHLKEYQEGYYNQTDTSFNWMKCRDCGLCSVEVEDIVVASSTRDLCFHIWHSNLFEDFHYKSQLNKLKSILKYQRREKLNKINESSRYTT